MLTQLDRSHKRLQTTRNLLKFIKDNGPKPSNEHLSVQILPTLAIVVFAQTLQSLNVPYVTSDRESDKDSASLAFYLNCPVVSNDSDFFIMMPVSESNTCLIPLSSMSLNCTLDCVKCDECKLKNGVCAFIRCKKFLPSGPGLNELPFIQRSLLATLLGNDYVSSNTFLKALPIFSDITTPLNRSATKEAHIKRRRNVIKKLIQWLVGFGSNRTETIRRILERIPKTERTNLKNKLLASLNSYQIQASVVFSMFEPYLANSSDAHLEKFDVQVDNQTHSYESPTLYDVENDLKVMECSIMQHWPNKLICAFRQYKLIPTYLDSIYNDGQVFNCSIESLYDNKSVHESSIPIRKLIYSLIMGIDVASFKGIKNEWSLNAERCVKEFDRKGAYHIRHRRLAIEPFIMDCETDFLENVFPNNLFTKPNCSQFWLDSLVLISVLYGNSQYSPEHKISHSTVILAFGAISIASHLLHLRILRETKKYSFSNHFTKCAEQFSSTLEKFGKSVESKLLLAKQRHEFRINFAHAFAELQAIYGALISLVSIVNSLTIHLCDKFELPPVSNLFPSGYLFHELACTIELIEPQFRYEHVKSILPILSCMNDFDLSLEIIDNYDQFVSKLSPSYVNVITLVRDKIKSKIPNDDRVTCPIISQNQAKVTKSKKCRRNRHNKLKSNQSNEDLIARLMLENGLSDDEISK